ncbi:MAG TPA: 2-hydroxychromene-2-carboxylate isomerase [Myxococcota bacterium]|jgi:2-hydroxychromene-2-carboxylate isomerase|nr:2-hydroxychromene-2-carboxylate isomerase [Myxococcota bacterium]
MSAAAAATAETVVPTLEMFFDFSSPFSYLAATQVEAVARRTGARLVWRPFLLGGLFRTLGGPDAPILEWPEPKRRHSVADLYRWADYWNVPFQWVSRFPVRTILPLRVVLAAGDAAAPFIHATYRAYWAEDRDISEESEVRALVAAAGLPADTMEKAGSAPVKDALKANGEEAARRGVFGAPTFFVHQPGDDAPLLFWGQDRLVLVEKALGGWRPKAG